MTPPQWLVAFDQALGRAGVAAHEIVAGGGRLLVTQQPGAAGITVRLDGEGWARTRRFVLGTDRPVDLDERTRQAVLHAVRSVEAHLPPELDEPAARFAPETGVEDRFRRLFPFCTVERSRAADATTVEVLVRTTARCNQACPFCSAPPPHPDPSRRALEACIASAAVSFPGAVLTLTGGEPTLRPACLAEVRGALAEPGLGRVQVQTNAVAFAERLAPDAIAPDPRLSWFVSLHALDEAVYDACTGTRRQLGPALSGIERLLRAGHDLVINCVVSRENLHHLDEYVRAFPQRVGASARVELHFSVLICPEHRPGAADLIVPYSDLAPALRHAVELARAAGVRVAPLRSSTHASLPFCVLDAEARAETARRPELEGDDPGWVKAKGCADCAESTACLGVPAPYAARLGLAELRPLPRR
jgi:pyruvate-formate lyase-activating enzyme